MISDFLYTLFIGPLETLFELIFSTIYTITQNPGVSIIGLSLIMNLLLLPLYNRTDAIQQEAIETEKRVKPIADHIKKHFSGSEQFMMLETCYRQNHYKPYDVLKGVAPLALEIPFFMAAYHYLSHLGVLTYAEFFSISNLAEPDRLLHLGKYTFNLLPILMTVINLVSSAIYTKDAPARTKAQLYIMAALFLILLYDSPAALAFYWTLNNLFSLVKNILVRLPKPMKLVSIVSSLLSLFIPYYGYTHRAGLSAIRAAILVLALILMNLPLVFYILKQKKKLTFQETVSTGKDYRSFLLSLLVLTILIGVMIPSVLINSSPLEFLSWNRGGNVHGYIFHTALIAGGTFLVWMNLFYGLAKPSGKKLMGLAAWILCGICLTDYMFFGKNYGNLSSQLVFDLDLQPSKGEMLLNLAVLCMVTVTVWLLWKKKPEILRVIGVAAVAAMVGISGFSMVKSWQTIEKSSAQQVEAKQPEGIFNLSKDGKNVVVLMMDRAVGGLLPYIFNEKPELADQFAGFTYYPNTLSFGGHTNLGLPGVFGGYEYIPTEMNKRDQEPLAQKHNEALTVMPLLFSQQDFKTTVCDPTYADYSWIPSLSLYDAYPDIDAHITMGAYSGYSAEDLLNGVSLMERKFLYYSLFKCAPVVLHKHLYDGGSYQNVEKGNSAGQSNDSPVIAEGENSDFSNSYSVLKYLPALTNVVEGSQNTFLMMCNDTAHSPQLLQLPDYVPSLQVDNTAYEEKIPQRRDSKGNTIRLGSSIQSKQYHCNMAAYLQLGKWLDYLREEKVFDNTRIILVSDHGYNMNLGKEYMFGGKDVDDILFYNPILLVKDFDSHTPFTVDERQMTNADVPALAAADLMENPVNPFTGNPITVEKSMPFYVSLSHIFDVNENNGNTFLPGPWAEVQGDMMDKNSWKILEEKDLPSAS